MHRAKQCKAELLGCIGSPTKSRSSIEESSASFWNSPQSFTLLLDMYNTYMAERVTKPSCGDYIHDGQCSKINVVHTITMQAKGMLTVYISGCIY